MKAPRAIAKPCASTPRPAAGAPDLGCGDERRRSVVRAQPLNGLDYLEVGDDQRTLTVYFLGKAPAELTKANLRITGGQRVRDIKVVEVEIHRDYDPERDDYMVVTVDRPGDFSTYRLCVVAIDEQCRPTDRALAGFDHRYACLDFSFAAACPSDLDCAAHTPCPQEPRTQPDISYLAKDYGSFRQLMLDRLAVIVPDWRERHVPDLGITLVELMAYVGDYLSYYQDAVATEAYLDTARQRESVRRHVRFMDYVLHEGNNARAWIALTTPQESLTLSVGSFYFVTTPGAVAGAMLREEELPRETPPPYLVYEPLWERKRATVLREARNEIAIYTWGDAECCLPKGATSAVLRDTIGEPPPAGGGSGSGPGPYEQPLPYEPPAPAPVPYEPPQTQSYGSPAPYGSKQPPYGTEQPPYGTQPPPAPEPPEHKLQLEAGDVLIFEEVKGPKTGHPADADPTHRHAVRLTKATADVDPLFNISIWHVEWSAEDALPFRVCVSAVGSPPKCEPIDGVTIVRGNVVLVDHGRRVWEDLGEVPATTLYPDCGDACTPSEPYEVAGPFSPPLRHPDVTFSEPIEPRAADPCGGASINTAWALVRQDPRRAVPNVTLTATRPAPSGSPTTAGAAAAAVPSQTWVPRRDLLASGPDDLHFVVEMDEERRARIRFGDGVSGRRPDAGTTFRATYRVGNGPIGNVGAEAIARIVFRSEFPSGAEIRARNPLAARGGLSPEPIDEAKLLAPHACRRTLERAVIAADYAAIVMRDFSARVQRAAATLRWSGSFPEVLVAIDPFGPTPASDDDPLLCAIARHLERYRRIGHEVHVAWARRIPLDITLSVCVLPAYLRAHVKAALLDAFGSRILRDGRRGLFHPDALTFGDGIYLSQLVAAAQAVQGVESVRVDTLERLFEGPNGEIDSGVLPLGPLEIAQLDNDPNFPEHGRLTLNLGGGR